MQHLHDSDSPHAHYSCYPRIKELLGERTDRWFMEWNRYLGVTPVAYIAMRGSESLLRYVEAMTARNGPQKNNNQEQQ